MQKKYLLGLVLIALWILLPTDPLTDFFIALPFLAIVGVKAYLLIVAGLILLFFHLKK